MEVEDFELASPNQRDLNLLKKVKNKKSKIHLVLSITNSSSPGDICTSKLLELVI